MHKLEVDHIVLAAPNLNEAIDYFKNQLNTIPVTGGRHIGLGTHNALLGLGDPYQKLYLELLAIDPEDHSTYATYPMGITKNILAPYVASWCLRCSTHKDIELINTEMKKIGEKYNHGEIRKGQRKKTSGEILSWKIAINYENILTSQGQIPFLIQWDNLADHPTTQLSHDNFCNYKLVFHSKRAKQLEANLKNLGFELSQHINFIQSNQCTSHLEIGKQGLSISF